MGSYVCTIAGGNGGVGKTTAETPIGNIDEEFAFPILGGIPSDLDGAGDEPLVNTSPESPAAAAFQELVDELEPVFSGAQATRRANSSHRWVDT